ncbi:hydrogenase maturation protease [bacterium]|nr:hydrogenase maturation protease [bacterium]MBL7052220.1 hydrogenase maturation protease [Candidatus Neomarinimicrobiota bacterium]
MLNESKILVLGLGNDLLADDAVGLLAVRELKKQQISDVEIVETAEHGMALLDYFIGFDSAILVDAIQTNSVPVGTIHEMDESDLSEVFAPSPHFSGLPEMIHIAREMQLDFPQRFKIFAIEVEDVLTLGGKISPKVRDAIARVQPKIARQIRLWKEDLS